MTAVTSARRRRSPKPGRTARACQVEPFLKWAGGKRQLLPALRRFYPDEFGTYFEPFVGSGAVFFDLIGQGLLADRPAILSDVNRDVVGCYDALRRDAAGVVRALRALEAGHARDGVPHYYAIRDGRFNPWRARLLAAALRTGAEPHYPTRVAAMLIYLNRTGYNGLFRLNRQGRFNVPAGRYERPRICDAENLRAVGRALRRPGVRVEQASFERVRELARTGDFIYFDPPYVPVSATARFTAYTADGFADHEQCRLQRVVIALARRGCQVLLSNSSAPATAALYEEAADARAAGLRTWRVPARRAINADASRRGPVLECLVTNIEPRWDEDGLTPSLGVN